MHFSLPNLQLTSDPRWDFTCPTKTKPTHGLLMQVKNTNQNHQQPPHLITSLLAPIGHDGKTTHTLILPQAGCLSNKLSHSPSTEYRTVKFLSLMQSKHFTSKKNPTSYTSLVQHGFRWQLVFLQMENNQHNEKRVSNSALKKQQLLQSLEHEETRAL